MDLLARTVYDADHEAFRASVRRFVAAEVVPNLDAWRCAGGAPAELFTALGEQGFLGTEVPEEYGGGGVEDPRFTAVLVEELAAAGALGVALVVARHAGVGVAALRRLPGGEDRARWLEGAASGETLVVPIALEERQARSVPAAARARIFLAVGEGDGEVVAVVPERAAVEPVSLLGGLDAGAADVQLEVDPADCMVIPGGNLVRRDLDVWSAVVAMAGARTAFDLTLAYVRERKVFGRPIAEFENTRFRLAELGAELTAAGCLVDACLHQIAAGTLEDTLASAAALVAADVHDRLVDQGMQLHGGYGYMREYPISHAFADARFLRVVSACTGERRPLLARAVGL